MKNASKLLMAVAVAAAVGTAAAAGPGGHAGAGGPPAGYGPGAENCATMGGPGYGGGPMMGGPGHGGGRMGGGGMMNPAVADARLADVKAQLKIGAEQENAWSGYATAVKAQADQRAKFREQMAATTDSTARLELREKHFAAQSESIKAVDAARSGLLAVLSPEQKATADRLIGFPGFARRGMGGPGS